MEKMLYFCLACIILCFAGYTTSEGQTVVLSENFAGFTTGTHEIPATYDYGATLDSRTQVPGWSGIKVNSAAGEIKIGTADVPGWIETPSIDLSGYEGKFRVKFDICRWPGDATTVQVLLNGTLIGTTLTPGDSFETIELSGSGGTSTSKIKFQALTKRFYLDNFSVTSNNIATGLRLTEELFPGVIIYPVPADKIIFVRNIRLVRRIEICDFSGKILRAISNDSGDEIRLEIESLRSGIYLLRLISGDRMQVRRFIKL